MNIERYGIFEFSQNGKTDGNPFTDYKVQAEFISEHETKTVLGFYDGDGVYKVRFMPGFEGDYRFRVFGTFSDTEYDGGFTVTAPTENNHGTVSAVGTHFYYSDGTPYYSIGTTCYNWTQQSRELQTQTLSTLKNSAFNKIRFCVFPKHYDYNYRDPILFPYEGTPVDNSGINKQNFEEYTPEGEGNKWDYARFNPRYFQNIEKNIESLMNLGIEADIILMHPYDRWGFSKMPDWANDLYIKYVIARFSAYRNVWWSLANEYDLCKYKTVADWGQYANLILKHDAYSHLRSIHNFKTFYDHSNPWITHCSIQRMAGNKELDFIPDWLAMYKKPVVIDEMCYEGDIEQSWGNISAAEMLRRMWKTVVLGGYPGHSECYDNDNIWWSHGGKLCGESYKRFGFLLDVIKSAGGGLTPAWSQCAKAGGDEFTLYYFGEHTPKYKIFDFGDSSFRVELLDTWNMTIKDMGIHRGWVKIDLPVKEFMALRVIKYE